MKKISLRTWLMDHADSHGISNNYCLTGVMKELAKLIPESMMTSDEILDAIYIAMQRIGMRSQNEQCIDYEAIVALASHTVILTNAIPEV